MDNLKSVHLGIDLGGTNIKFGIISEEGKILKKGSIHTKAETGPEKILSNILEHSLELAEWAKKEGSKIASLGIGVPGTTDPEKGTVVFAPNIFWKNVEVVSVLKAGGLDMPIFITQDTRAAAWGEFQCGAAKGVQNFALITIGTGVGCGLILNGKIYNGGLGTAGEFGHQIVELNGNYCNCGRYGCLESHAGGLALVKIGKEKIKNFEAFIKNKEEGLTVEDIFNMAMDKNPDAVKIVEDTVIYIGKGVVSLINLLSPEMIVLSGGIGNAPDTLLLDPLIKFIKEHAYFQVAENIKVCHSGLLEDAPLIGAALLGKVEN